MTISDDTVRSAPAAAQTRDRNQTPDLVSLVCSRMAHDLNNPVGAIANGVELVGLTGQADGPELALITESVENARRRIKNFRIAFGAAAPGQTVAAAEIRTLIAPGPDGRRIEIDWPVADDLPRADAKAVFLALMCLESALPWGGQVHVRSEANGETDGETDGWHIAATAERMQVEPVHWLILEGGPLPGDLPAKAVHFALLARELAARGRPMTFTGSDTGIDLSF